jgi:hypothetical protein
VRKLRRLGDLNTHDTMKENRTGVICIALSPWAVYIEYKAWEKRKPTDTYGSLRYTISKLPNKL